jgi:type I restriction enzyme S subunit
VKAAAKWPSLPLTDAFWFQEGPGVRNWQFTTSGIKLLNVANIEKGGTLNLEKTDRHLDETEVAKKYSHFLVDAGDLVIASSGISFDDDGLLRTRGAFVREENLPLCLNTSTIRFKAIDGMSDLRFLKLWLNGREFRSQITKFVTGTAQQNFGPSHLKATKITLPPLAEQRRIAEVLDRAEALRAKRRAALAQLDSLTQSLFLDLFGKPKENPKGWPLVPLMEICSPKQWPTISTPELTETGFPVFGANGLIGRYTEYNHEDPTVLITCRGATCGTINVSPPKCYVTGNAMALDNPDPKRITIEYLAAVLRMRSMADTISGTAQPQITRQNLQHVTLPIPPIPLQREFARRVTAVEALKTAQRASLAELDALFATLQHRAFKGEL